MSELTREQVAEIMAFGPGRDLDAMVAFHVFEWHRGEIAIVELAESGSLAACHEMTREMPHYSTDIAAAWEVVKKMHVDGECISLIYRVGDRPPHNTWGWVAEFRHISAQSVADTAPHAICIAAVLATLPGTEP